MRIKETTVSVCVEEPSLQNSVMKRIICGKSTIKDVMLWNGKRWAIAWEEEVFVTLLANSRHKGVAAVNVGVSEW